MIEGRYEGKLAEDNDYGGTCALDLIDGDFVLTLARYAPYQIEDRDIYVGTFTQSGGDIVLQARLCHHVHSETIDQERTERCDRRFNVHATAARLELMEPEHVPLVRRQVSRDRLRRRDLAISLVHELGARFSPERRRAARELEACGKDAVPLLIDSLEDQRSFEDIEPSIGAPAGAAPRRVRRTVGEECRRLLTRIVTAPYTSPHEPKVVRKPRAPFFEVRNWRAWWAINQDRSLADLHKEIQAAVDRYWLAGEQTQVLDEGVMEKFASLVGADDENIARYADEAVEFAVYRLKIEEPGHVPHYALSPPRIPVGTRNLRELNELAMSFHAYRVLGSNDAVVLFGNAARRRFRQHGQVPLTATGTRTALFMECRRRVHTASDMTEEDWRYTDALLRGLRSALLQRIAGDTGDTLPTIITEALRAARSRWRTADDRSPPQ